MPHRTHLVAVSRSPRALFVAVSASACVLVGAVDARADEAADTATARALGVEGVTLAESGKCKEAIEKLERAEKLHHAPTTATRLAECEIEIGRLVAGTEHLQRVIRERLPANAHPAFVTAVARAQKVLDSTLPRLSTLRLTIVAEAGTKSTITIDDEPVSDAIVDTNRRIDPGTHKIVVRSEGFLPGTATQVFGEGDTKSVVIELRRDPTARPAIATKDTSSPPPPQTTSSSSTVPAIALVGVGAIGLGVGLYGAMMVDQKQSQLDARCDPNRVCPTDLRGEIDSAKDWATVSTVGLIGGGLGIASGVALLLLSSGSRTPAASASRVQVRPVVGATSLGVDGRF